MDVRDSWATEYNRKSFSVVVDEGDWLHWLHEFVVEPDGEILLQDIPAKVKGRVMRLLAYVESATALREWGAHEGDAGMQELAADDLTTYETELSEWAKALKAKFGVVAAT